MKRILSLLLIAVMVFALAACGTETDSTTPTNSGETSAPASNSSGEKTVLNVWSFTEEVPGMIERYAEMHPEFAEKYEIKSTIIATTDGAYQPALDQALAGGGADAPDIFAAEAAFVLKYAKGDGAQFSAPYKDLGIDIEAKLAEAEIAQYTVDIGSNTNGEVVGLGYQATGGAFIYRRSLALDTWGTEDPVEIKDIIGPGWDKFFDAAEDLKAKGYGVISGDGDLWHPVENSSDEPWVVDGKLVMDPKREAFLDLSKQLKDNNYHNDTQDWQDAWFADMKDAGEKKIFGFFGPAWLINYVMAGNAGDTAGDWAVTEPPVGFFWGGTWVFGAASSDNKEVVGDIIEWITLDTSEQGLQYMWANGTLNGEGGTKDSVASGKVMSISNGELDFLGGQDMFDVFIPANKFANGKNLTQYDETINMYWRDQVRAYTAGTKSREDAIKDFKQMVADNLDIIVE
jgi:hypothetical protein